MHSDAKNKCAIIVSSCDAYSDAWAAFFTLFFKYWPDCPFAIYLISNGQTYNDNRVMPILIKNDQKWASNMKRALEVVNAPYVLYMQEDYFFQKKVDSQKILSLVELMQSKSLGYIRLVPSPRPDGVYNDFQNLGILSTHTQYRTSLQAALWDTRVLNKLLVAGESGWQMEAQGTIRSYALLELFLSAKDTSFINYYAPTAIKKGKWMPGALALCKKEGIVVDTSRRKTIPVSTLILGKIRSLPLMAKVKSIPVIGPLLTKVTKRVW